MKEKMKRIGKSLLSLTLAFSMVFSVLMLPDIVHINDTKEASAATVSSVMGTDKYIHPMDISVVNEGSLFTLGGGANRLSLDAKYNKVTDSKEKITVEVLPSGIVGKKMYVISSPLAKTTESDNKITNYSLNSVFKNLYSAISDAYYICLVDYYDDSNKHIHYYGGYVQNGKYVGFPENYMGMCRTTATNPQFNNDLAKKIMADYDMYSGNVQITTSTAHMSTEVPTFRYVPLGSISAVAMGVERSGSESYKHTIALNNTDDYSGIKKAVTNSLGSFAIDTTKVYLNGSTIEPLVASTGLNVTQAMTSVEEGSSINLSKIISVVTYSGGSSNGKTAAYTITTDAGTIDGTTWTAPSGINTNKTVTLTIKDTAQGFTTTKTVTVTPHAAKRIAVEKGSSFPEYITTGDTIDLTTLMTVKGYDSAELSDGTISDYTLTTDDSNITVNGTKLSLNGNLGTKDVTITVTATGAAGSVSYSGKTASFKLTTKSNLGAEDRNADEDENGFRTYLDETTGITWKYRCNDKGNIRYLYTDDNVGNIISDGKVLLIPSSINGVSVIGIGGGSDVEGNIIPFIPTIGDNVNNTWTSVYIPKSVKYINDGAFYQNKTERKANIIIPDTVAEIGVRAFKSTNLRTVTLNKTTSTLLMNVKTEAFADVSSLEAVSIRGAGVKLGKYAFSDDTGLTKITIPNGTVINDNSYAFKNATGLTLIKMDTDTVASNVFSETKNLTKVIFGENVKDVKHDWRGTAASNTTAAATADCSIYVLNADTVFEFDKTSGNSSFGYAGNAAVTGKYKSTAGDSEAYDDSGDIVKGKISYLAYHGDKTNYQDDTDEYTKADIIKGYMTGTATAVTVQTEDEPANNKEVTNTQETAQTAIEASYTGIIFGGRQLERDKISVYKMYETEKKDAYDADEFYVMRSTDANALLSQTHTPVSKDGSYVARDKDTILSSFEEKNTISVTDEDVSVGAIDIKVIVLKTDNDGDILVNRGTSCVEAYTYTLAIPVKQYTAEDDFFENYGSYNTVITKVNELNKSVTDLTAELELKEQKIAELQAEADRLEVENERITEELSDARAEVTRLTKELAESKKQIAVYTSNYAELTEILKQYAKNLKLDETGYLGTLTSDDTTKDVVYVAENMYAYEKTEDAVVYESKQYPVYFGHDNTTDGDESGVFYFLVTKSGVVILSRNVSDDEDAIVSYATTGTVYTDTAAATQRKANALTAALGAQLSSMNDQITADEAALTAIRDKITSLKAALGIEDDEMDGKTEEEQLDIILNKVLTLNNQITSYDSVVKSVYKQLMSEDLTNEQLTDINNVLQAMTSKITELKDTNQKLTDDVASRDETINDLNDKLNQSEDSVENLTTQLEQMKADAAALDKTVKEQEQTIAEAKDKVTELETQNGNLENEIGSLNDNITKLEQNNRDQSEQISNLQTTLSSKDTEIADNTATIEDLKKVIEQAKEEAAALKEKNASQQETIDSLRENVENLTNIKDEQATQIAVLKEDLNTLTGQNTALQEKVTSLTATVNEQEQIIAELKRLLTAQKEAVEKLEKESEQYLLTTDEAVKLFGLDSKMSKEEMLTAIRGFVNAKTTITSIQSAFTTDKDGEELVAFLQAKASGSGNSGSTTPSTPSNSNTNSGSTADYASGFKDGYTAGAANAGTNSTTLATLQAQNADLTAKVNTLTNENKDLTTQVNTLTNGIDEVYDALPNDGMLGVSPVTDSVKKLGTVKSAVTSMEKSNKTLDKKNTSLNKKVISLTSANKKLKTTNSSLSKKNKSLSDKNKSLTSTNKQLVATNNTLQASLQSARNAASQQVASVPASKGTAIESQSNTKDNTKKQESKKTEEKKEVTEKSASTESAEDKPDASTNLPSLDDKVKGTTPIYPTPEVSTEQSSTETPDNTIPGTDSETNDNIGDDTDPIPKDMNDSSLPIGPIVFGVIIVVGVSVLLIAKKKKKAADDIDEI